MPFGTPSIDNITLSQNNIVYDALDGDDVISVLSGRAIVYGGAGNDSITIPFEMDSDNPLFIFFGGLGNDTLTGSYGNDTLLGGAGTDSIRGDSGDDIIYSGQGNDSVLGGLGNDSVFGDRDDDTLTGSDGNDRVFGGRGNDFMGGDAGNDTLYGNLGADQYNGGLGADVFVLSIVGEAGVTIEMDIIQDFNPSQGDKIGLLPGLAFTDLSITALGQVRIDYTSGGVSHTVILSGYNTMLTQADFVSIAS